MNSKFDFLFECGKKEMFDDNKKIIRLCELESGIICSFDVCAPTIDAYKDWPRKLVYIGKGKFHSFDGVSSSDKTIRHFWIDS